MYLRVEDQDQAWNTTRGVRRMGRFGRQVAAAISLVAVATLTAEASPPPAPALVKAIESASLESPAPASGKVFVDLDVLSALRNGSVRRASLAIPGAAVTVEFDPIENHDNGHLVGRGRLVDRFAGSFTCIFNGPIFMGVVHDAELGTIDILPQPDGTLLARRVDLSALPYPSCPRDPPDSAHPNTPPNCPHAVTTLEGYNADDGSMVDIMVVYTAAARDAAGGVAQIESKIDLAIADANTARNNSQITSQVRVIRKALIAYTETGSGNTDLPRLSTPNDGFLDSVHPDRDTYGADLVSLWVSTLDFGGVAWSPAGLTIQDFQTSGFSVMRQDNATFLTFAHEIGHNFGCAHDRANDGNPSAALYPFSFGYREPGSVWKTIMAYPPGTTIPYFSNPNVNYSGPLGNPGPTGVAENQPLPCNNAHTHNNSAYWLANYRPATVTSPPPRFYVKASAPNGGDGTNWASAMNDLQLAIGKAVAARGATTEIWVAAGTYKPDRGRNDRTMSFRPAEGVSIYGGFAGTETLLSQRSIAANVCILSGDIGTIGVATDNSLHVIDATDLAASAVLDGFTITGGNSNLIYPDESGGGMRSQCSHASIVNCTFTGNSAAYGGAAIWNYNGSAPTFTGCTISNNSSTGMGSYGGAVLSENSSPTFMSCTFSANSTTNGGGAMFLLDDGAPILNQCNFNNNTAGFGAAIYCLNITAAQINQCTFTNNSAPTAGAIYTYQAAPSITGCTFTQNHAISNGAGGAIGFATGSTPAISGCTFSQNTAECCGGGLVNYGSSPTISMCTFVGNTANYGAGAYEQGAGGAQYINCRFYGNIAQYSGGGLQDSDGGNPTVVDGVFSGNSVPFGDGGAVNNYNGSNSLLINCTLSNNTAANNGGGVFNYTSSAALTNCILWQNATGGIQDETGQIGNFSSTATLNYCIVQGWTGALGGTANNGLNPLFVDANGADNIFGTVDDNVRLQNGSPAIDSANKSAIPVAVTMDAGGNPRFVNAPCIADTGLGTPPLPDRGAYEHQPLAPLLGDLNASGTVTIADIPGFVAVLLGANTAQAHVAAADMNCDGLANGRDVKGFAQTLVGP